MATKEIEKLLTRYYDGITTEEEEARLAKYFKDGGVPDSLRGEQDFFTALHACRTADMQPEGLDRKLEAQIDRWSGRHKPRRMTTRLRYISGIAASVLAVATLGAYLHSRTSITPEEQATLAQAQTALVQFSATLNKGFSQIAAAQEKTADLNRKINKCIVLTKTDEK